jgi:hypothetical protein
MIDKMNGEIDAYKEIKDLCEDMNKIQHSVEIDSIIRFCDRMIEQLQETVDGAMESMYESFKKNKINGDLSDETIN